MKIKLIALLFFSSIAACHLLEAAPIVNEGNAFAQLSSMQTLIPINGAQIIPFANTDSNIGFDTSNHTKLKVKQSGTYFIMASGQVGANKNAMAAGGYATMWLLRNGQVIPNTAVRQFVYTLQSTSVLNTQAVLNLYANDMISVGYSSSQPEIGLIATTATVTEPPIPSIIFSIFKVH